MAKQKNAANTTSNMTDAPDTPVIETKPAPLTTIISNLPVAEFLSNFYEDFASGIEIV